jgi:hypothetical protein
MCLLSRSEPIKTYDPGYCAHMGFSGCVRLVVLALLVAGGPGVTCFG